MTRSRLMSAPAARRAAAVAAAAVLALLWRRRKRARTLAVVMPGFGEAIEIATTAVERSEGHGVGGPAAIARVDDGTGAEQTIGSPVRFDELMEGGGAFRNVTTYCYDATSAGDRFLFLEVTSLEALWDEPFHDRGIRKLATGRCFVASAATAAAWAERRWADGGLGTTLHVWNTGRCGSTLLHRLLWASGAVASVSEPYWFDQLTAEARGAVLSGCSNQSTSARRRGLARTAHALDFHVARRLRPAAVACAMNPKGSGHYVLVDTIAALPSAGARQLFMYRDVTKVAESFCSIFAAQQRQQREAAGRARRVVVGLIGGLIARLGKKPPPATFASRRLRELSARNALASCPAPPPMARMIATSWSDAVSLWREQLADAADVEGMLTLRMDEFVDKTRREAICEYLLRWIGAGTDGLAAAVAQFGEHSQKGNTMARSSNAGAVPRALSDEDTAAVAQLARAAIGGDDPTRLVLPRSLAIDISV